jgi:hypothetical protein
LTALFLRLDVLQGGDLTDDAAHQTGGQQDPAADRR